MKIYTEISLRNFEFWAGARDFAQKLTDNELDQIECALEETYCEDTPSETDINDFFWFEQETIADWLGLTEKEIWDRE